MENTLTADGAYGDGGGTGVSHSGNCSSIPTSDYQPWEYALYGSLMIFLTCGTVFGNILVLLTITMVKKLRQQPANMLLLSLCVSDQMIALTVEPFAMYKTLNGFWAAGDKLCQMYLFLDVMCCTASILNLSVITVDRYLVITRPFSYTLQRTRKLMCIMIACVWVIATIVSAVGFAWPQKSALAGSLDMCAYPEHLSYQIYATVMAFYGPLIIMLTLWGRIFMVAHKMAQADKVQHVALRSQQQNQAIPTETQLKELQILHHAVSSNTANGVIETDDIEDHINTNGFDKKNSEQFVLTIESKPRQSASVASSGGNNNNSSSNSNNNNIINKKKSGENKALITVAVIMGCFTICWLPFFMVMLVGSIYNYWYKDESINCATDEVVFPVFQTHSAMSLLLWLGYVNSFMNPIIYAKFNRDFRRPFRQFLRCHCDVNARMRIDQYAEQYGAQGGKADINANLQNALRSKNGALMTRREAEEAGLLTQSTKRSKLPKEHLMIDCNNHIDSTVNEQSIPI